MRGPFYDGFHVNSPAIFSVMPNALSSALFWTLAQKIFPLYLLIAVGVVGGRYLKIQRETVAELLIYLLVPGVVLWGVLTTPLSVSRLSLPFFFWVFCTFMGLVGFAIAG